MTELSVRVVADPATDDSRLEELTLNLRQEISELEVESVGPVRESPGQPGAKGDPITLGMLLVQLTTAGGAVTSVVHLVQNWLTRNERQSVTVQIGGDSITLTGATTHQQDELIRAFVRRHSRSG